MDRYDACWLKKTGGIRTFFIEGGGGIKDTLKKEAERIFGADAAGSQSADLIFEICGETLPGMPGAYEIKTVSGKTVVSARDEAGLLYGFYAFARKIRLGETNINTCSAPHNRIRMVNHWDNFDGTVERGYAGSSLFFKYGDFLRDFERIEDYARLLASVGINAVSINNVNVKRNAAGLICPPHLKDVKDASGIFVKYGVKLFLSINFAAPVILGGTSTADPLDESVIRWWNKTAGEIYETVPGFGGFLIKADSEGEPGPFTYGRSHAEGANMLASALAPYGGHLIWRCFVYNCHQDWRDRKTDRARAAYDNFKPRDGEFLDNVSLQIKNGPMDFQIREPVSPLFGALESTNQILEFQITQEYTGQQRHVCYLAPMWKEVLDFNIGSPDGKTKTVAETLNGRVSFGLSAVSNIGDDFNWTGHKLAQANFYGYGRLCWDTSLSPSEILTEWIRQTFDLAPDDEKIIFNIMSGSRLTYEKYTSPLGVGWMVKPSHHYGPDVDGYEYDRWGTYHFADRDGIGVDRTKATGTGYAALYNPPHNSVYEDINTCPDELLLFFHHVPYTHVLKSGKTVIQHIYDTHFDGYGEVLTMVSEWAKLKGKVNERDFENVSALLLEQKRCAMEWRDQVNTYFFRKSGIGDERGRRIY